MSTATTISNTGTRETGAPDASDYARPTARVHFGVFYSGVGPGVDWTAPDAIDQIDFEAFRKVAQVAERGLFDAFFFGEGLRLREHLEKLIELNVAGRPDSQVALAAIAAVTTRIGIVATQNATYHEPFDLARRLATLDILSGGRAAWNIVTTVNEWTGENFRRGGWVAVPDRYTHAEANVRLVRALWDAGQNLDIATRRDAEQWGRTGTRVTGDGDFAQVSATATVPPSPQGHPVLFQSGDSDGGRDLAARQADVIFSRHVEIQDALKFAADIRRRVEAAGRPADDVLILPGGGFILGATEDEAQEKARWRQQVTWTDQHIVQFVEKSYGRELPELDPDGPLPDFDPEIQEISVEGGTVGHYLTPKQVVDNWRAISAEHGFTSIRQLVLHLGSERAHIGTPAQIADELAHAVRSGAYDGINLGLSHVPAGLDDIVNTLIPELQERGVYPAEYIGTTLREHLGLRPPLTRRTA
ncbi:NtaA/DmoA family FMN-dependent monooxygenase [Microbacterium sp.]|uniref:NtaA/DmoA family FMN-dependent monooxygenase n=1 Tax=Microbacterium sp. TaxID=51671 RepID=UPI003C7587DD